MPILCGTDLSLNSARAVRVAGILARRLSEPLLLLHVVDRDVETPGAAGEPCDAKARLDRVTERLRTRGVPATPLLRHGVPDEVLVEEAARTGARLIVVASLGRRPPSRWVLGSVAERTAQTSSVPALVVQRTDGFRRWGTGQGALRVVTAVDRFTTGGAALRAAADLGRGGPLDLEVVHVYSPAAERRRLGLVSPLEPVDDPHVEVERVLLRDLREQSDHVLGSVHARFRVEVASGDIARQLVTIAAEESADLLVVGSHQRRGVSRLWYGSVSNAVLHLASGTNVLSVPVTGPRARRSAPRLRRVLVATDFSEPGDHAVAHAYAALPSGGVVYLVHVVEEAEVQALAYPHYDTGWPPTPEQRARQEPVLMGRLRALIPAEAEARGIETRVEMLEGRHAAQAICGAAERLDVDLICLGAPARSRPVTMFGGSVARRVLAASVRPILIVPGPRED